MTGVGQLTSQTYTTKTNHSSWEKFVPTVTGKINSNSSKDNVLIDSSLELGSVLAIAAKHSLADYRF